MTNVKAEACGWKAGIDDAMQIVRDRRQFLWSLGPAEGVIYVLDEILVLLVQLQAMQNRGHYQAQAIVK